MPNEEKLLKLVNGIARSEKTVSTISKGRNLNEENERSVVQ